MSDRPAHDFACARCNRDVVAERSNYETFERMHWICFHYEFEHEGDPDMRCLDPSCPTYDRSGPDLPGVDRRSEVIQTLDDLVGEWSNGNPDDWENWTIPQYLDAMSAWLGSADISYIRRKEPVPRNGWDWFRDALRAAARYE